MNQVAYGEGGHFGKCGNWPSRMDRGVEIGLAVGQMRPSRLVLEGGEAKNRTI